MFLTFCFVAVCFIPVLMRRLYLEWKQYKHYGLYASLWAFWGLGLVEMGLLVGLMGLTIGIALTVTPVLLICAIIAMISLTPYTWSIADRFSAERLSLPFWIDFIMIGIAWTVVFGFLYSITKIIK
jgi:hypothetical protein